MLTPLLLLVGTHKTDRLTLVAKGRTNMELREHFILPTGASQSMSHFKVKTPSKSVGDLGLPGATVPTHWSRSGTPTSAPIMKVHDDGIIFVKMD